MMERQWFFLLVGTDDKTGKPTYNLFTTESRAEAFQQKHKTSFQDPTSKIFLLSVNPE